MNGSAIPSKDQNGKKNRPSKEKHAPRLASLWDRCDVSALPGYGTDNEIKKSVRAVGGSYDKAVTAYIRRELRTRFPECRFSVTSGGAGYLTAINIEIKSSPFLRVLVIGATYAIIRTAAKEDE